MLKRSEQTDPSRGTDAAGEPRVVARRGACWAASVVLGFYLLLGVVLKLTHGHFHELLLFVLVAGFLGYVWVGLRDAGQPLGRSDLRVMTRRIGAVTMLLAMLMWLSPELLYRQDNAASRLFVPVTAIILAATAILWLTTLKTVRLAWQFEFGVWLTAVCGALALRVLTLFASPEPFIDVWVIGNLGSDAFLAGTNPYVASYPDIYQGQYDHVPHFFYWPAYMLTVAPFRGLFGDVRAATIATDVVIVGLLYAMSRRLGIPRKTGRLLCLLWLLHPVSLFVLELSWIDPVLMAGMMVVFICLLNGWWAATGVALAYLVGIKQYGALVAFLVLATLITRRWRGLDDVDLRTLVLSGAGATIAIFGPFLLLDAGAFYESTLQPYLDVGLRPDALSIPAEIYNSRGTRVPDHVLLGIVLLVIGGVTTWLVRSSAGLVRLTFAITVVLCTFFLLGKLAFCNYYYLVSFCALLHLLMRLSPVSTSWLVIRPPGLPATASLT